MGDVHVSYKKYLLPTVSLYPFFYLLFMLALFLGCSSGGGGNHSLPAPLGESYPIDGQINLFEFDTINELTLNINDNFGQGLLVKTTTLRWVMTNDDRNIYIALEWIDDSYEHNFNMNLGPQVFDGIKLFFDNDGNGSLDDGEDERTVIAASVGSQYIDQHVSSGDETDLIGDGFAKLSYDQSANTYQAEFLFPLVADTNGEDAYLTNVARYNIFIYENVNLTDPANPSGNGVYAYGAGTDSSSWPNVPMAPAGPHAYPELPSNLAGLIVFISDHEVTNGEIYSFDPLGGRVNRVTILPNLYKENVSLSHDRTRVAFHGTINKDDFSSYEIYSVDIDGTNLIRLTNNTVLDGHPGWSPDDAQIAYASFRDLGQASVIIMDADGNEISDLTPPGVDDNDPDYLPDGRILIKTDRFSASPQVRIAVMNGDGSGIEQLTFVAGVSDHDPVGDGTYTVFERFRKGTNFATDVESGFTPWDLIEARIDGSGEKTILSDGWVNWLPVYDPSGQYLCYLKNSGYTAAYLMTRDGRNLGRLIPNITRIRYIDWK